MNVIEMTAAQLSAAIREGKTTAVEAAEAVLAQIEKEDKNYNCYVTVDRDGALTQARAVQELFGMSKEELLKELTKKTGGE